MLDNVKIPQNIRIEDKIVGPLSLRQILLIAGGGGVSYVLLTTVKRASGVVPITAHLIIWWPLIICAAFALIRINDITLTRYLLLMAECMSKPRIRGWFPRQGIIINIQTPSGKSPFPWGKRSAKEKEGEKADANATGKQNVAELVDLLNEGGDVTTARSVLSLRQDPQAEIGAPAQTSPETPIAAAGTGLDDSLPGDSGITVEPHTISPVAPLDGVRESPTVPLHA